MNLRFCRGSPIFHWFSGARSFAFSVGHIYRVAYWNYRTVVFW